MEVGIERGAETMDESHHPEAGIPVGIGPAKDAPQAPVYDAATKEVK